MPGRMSLSLVRNLSRTSSWTTWTSSSSTGQRNSGRELCGASLLMMINWDMILKGLHNAGRYVYEYTWQELILEI